LYCEKHKTQEKVSYIYLQTLNRVKDFVSLWQKIVYSWDKDYTTKNDKTL